jgi:hypothetical protein
MLNIFKTRTKEEIEQQLQSKVDELNEKWKEEINHYCKIKSYIFILRGFKHNGKNVCVQFEDKNRILNAYDLNLII